MSTASPPARSMHPIVDAIIASMDQGSVCMYDIAPRITDITGARAVMDVISAMVPHASHLHPDHPSLHEHPTILRRMAHDDGYKDAYALQGFLKGRLVTWHETMAGQATTDHPLDVMLRLHDGIASADDLTRCEPLVTRINPAISSSMAERLPDEALRIYLTCMHAINLRWSWDHERDDGLAMRICNRLGHIPKYQHHDRAFQVLAQHVTHPMSVVLGVDGHMITKAPFHLRRNDAKGTAAASAWLTRFPVTPADLITYASLMSDACAKAVRVIKNHPDAARCFDQMMSGSTPAERDRIMSHKVLRSVHADMVSLASACAGSGASLSTSTPIIDPIRPTDTLSTCTQRIIDHQRVDGNARTAQWIASMLTPDPVVVMHVQQHAEAWSRYTERMVYMQDAIATICHDDDTLSQSVLDVYVHSKGPIPVHVIPWLASLTADPKVHDALWNSDRGVLPVPTRVPYKATESSMAILMPMQHMPSWSQRHVESIMRSYATTGSDERLWGYELTPSSHPHRTGSGRVSQMLMASLARVGCSDEHVYAHIDQPKLHLALRAAITDRAMCMVMDAVGVTPVDCRRLADTIRHQGTAYPKSIMYRMMPHMADVDGALDVITALQAMAPDGATSEE